VAFGQELNYVRHFFVSLPLDPNEDCAIKMFELSNPFRQDGNMTQSPRLSEVKRRQGFLQELRHDKILSVIALYKVHCIEVEF
jgi:hypothetical protein